MREASAQRRPDSHGATDLDIFEPESQGPIIRRLFHLFTTAPEAAFSKVKPGWFDVAFNSGEAWSLLDELLCLDDDSKAIHARKDEVGRLDLGPILGFDEPPLRLTIDRRSKQLCRYKFIVRGLRGHGPAMETWPSLSTAQVEEDRRATTTKGAALRLVARIAAKAGKDEMS